MANIKLPRHSRWGRLGQGALVGATLGLGALAAPVSIAAPDDGTWDVEAYDACMSKTVRNADLCCLDSGGVPTSDPEDTQPDGSPNCYAPPAQPAGAEQGTAPRTPRGIIDTPIDTATEVAPDAGPTRPLPTLIAPG
ncbi:hypothetical protein [Mycolicibacterium neworleansense]|uniref:Uncharacterized protein n=1 Tax=Mycolicibacterium neworleansense TaxID=146018 RepID=A0A0H5RKD8_9MYCO|nr:hypothetical protein [Mycolicibacterium neworleansense]MCV7360440.1 hypothetical protein [Mycolicibacterium neworleansense]CRZ14610.1 hypothetical protein BN2156_01460 [Mycolicibacterium neworleansense]